MTHPTLDDVAPPPGYRSVRTEQRVPGQAPEIVTRWEWRARRAARRANARRLIRSYEWVVVHEGGRWKVVAFQCKAVPV